MEHGAVVHRAGQVGGESAARGEAEIERRDASVILESDFIVVEEVVALAGADHVVVAVGAQLDRPAGGTCEQRRCHGIARGLRLLAAEAAAEPAQLHGDVRIRNGERRGDEVLDLGRMLSRRMHEHLAALAGNRERDLAFEVEMLLPAAAQLALDPVLRRRGHVAALRAYRRQHEGLLLQRLLDGDDRLERLVAHLRKPRRAARALDARRGDREERLAAKFDEVGCEERLIRQHRPDVVDARDVGGRDDGNDAGRAAHRVEIHVEDLGVRFARHAEGGVERARRLGQIVDVARFARDVQIRAVVRQ